MFLGPDVEHDTNLRKCKSYEAVLTKIMKIQCLSQDTGVTDLFEKVGDNVVYFIKVCSSQILESYFAQLVNYKGLECANDVTKMGSISFH